LPAYCSRYGLRRVHIGEEAGRVVLDPLHSEAVALVLSRCGVLKTGDEAVLGAMNAAYALSNIGARIDLDWVRECNAWRTRLACDGFMDVGSSAYRGRVIATESGQSDVVANDVIFAVETELIKTLSACKTASQSVVGIDDLLRSRSDLVCGSIFRRSLHISWRWVGSLSSGGSRSCC
jgi:hypothetical protein